MFRASLACVTLIAGCSLTPEVPEYESSEILGHYLIQLRVVDAVPGMAHSRSYRKGLVYIIEVPATDPYTCIIHELDHVINPTPSHGPDEPSDRYCIY